MSVGLSLEVWVVALMTGLSRLVAVDEEEREESAPAGGPLKLQHKSVISFYQVGALLQDNCFSSFFKTWSFLGQGSPCQDRFQVRLVCLWAPL